MTYCLGQIWKTSSPFLFLLCHPPRDKYLISHKGRDAAESLDISNILKSILLSSSRVYQSIGVHSRAIEDASRPAHRQGGVTKQKMTRGRSADVCKPDIPVLCRYSSLAARDTKHWPCAKTNYNDPYSTRDSTPSGPQPFNVLYISTQGWRRARASQSSPSTAIQLPFCLFLKSIPASPPSLCLTGFPPSRPSQVETRSACDRIKKLRELVAPEKRTRVRARRGDGRERKRRRGTLALYDSSGRN